MSRWNRSLSLWVVVLTGLLSWPIHAQPDRFQKGRPERSPADAVARVTGTKWSPLTIMLSDAARDELSLTEDQQRRFGECERQLTVDVVDKMPLRGPIPEELQSELKSHCERQTTALNEILNPAQRERLDQIVLQARLPQAFTDPDMVTILDLTNGQREQLHLLIQDYTDRIDELTRATRGFAPKSPEERLARRAKLEDLTGGKPIAFKRWELREEADASCCEVLSEPQRQKLRELVGADFDVDALSASELADRARLGMVPIQAVAADASRIQSAEVCNGFSSWTPAGFVNVTGLFSDSVADVIVRAPGYATARLRLTGAEKERAAVRGAKVTLVPGMPATLWLRPPEGMAIPQDCLPQTYFVDYAHRVRNMWQAVNLRNGKPDFNFLNLIPQGIGEYAFRIPEEPFYVAIYHPGFLRFFERGPFTEQDIIDGELVIDLPRPASFTASLAKNELAEHVASAQFELLWPSDENSIDVGDGSEPKGVTSLQFLDLAPGRYRAAVNTQLKDESTTVSDSRAGKNRFYDTKFVTLEAGENRTVEWEVRPYDPNAFRGQESLKIRILAPDGSPAVGRKATVTWTDLTHFIPTNVFDGDVPADGFISIEGVTDRFNEAVPRGPFTLYLDGDQRGFFRLTPGGPREFDFRVKPLAGDPAPNSEFVNLANGATEHLADYRGRIVVLEFWATWCGPCQAPMRKLDALVAEKTDQWSGRVAVIPISTDMGSERPVTHMKNSGWSHLGCYWNGPQSATDSDHAPNQQFAILGVPETILIDEEGVIRWRGNPNDEDIGAKLDAMLKAN